MKIGNKIRKIRELKNIAPKDMADRLNITPQGYSRIERDEVALNIERLLEIAGIFEMKPEDLLTFDEKVVFNNYHTMNGSAGFVYGNLNTYPEEFKKLYDENAKLQEEKLKLQDEVIKMLQEKIKFLEGK
jgi:transcriptional regulator with XRE-family HTH domain